MLNIFVFLDGPPTFLSKGCVHRPPPPIIEMHQHSETKEHTTTDKHLSMPFNLQPTAYKLQLNVRTCKKKRWCI